MKINGATAATYKYNQIGNMTTKTESFTGMLNNSDLSSIGGDGLVYPASGANSVRPHAVTSTGGSQSLTIGYDANGNMAAQGTDSYTYDAENHIKTRTVGNQTVTYTYDGGGNLLKRVNGDGTSTVYIGGAFEKNFNAQGAATGTTKYYSALGRPFAYRTAGSGGGTGTLQWILADHLGSTTGVVNPSGTLASSQKYWPYGAVRSTSGTLGTDKLFTGQRAETTPPDSALGLDNYNARFYSTTLGRFVSADSVTKDGLNRYAYARSNPIEYVDPSGRCTRALRRLAGTYIDCSQGVASEILRCAFSISNACKGDDPNSVMWRNFARWIIRDRDFFNTIDDLIHADRKFYQVVIGIRYRPRDHGFKLTADLDGLEEGWENWSNDGRQFGTAGGRMHLEVVSFSYLDVEITVDVTETDVANDNPGYNYRLTINHDENTRIYGRPGQQYSRHIGISPFFGGFTVQIGLRPDRDKLGTPICGDLPGWLCPLGYMDWHTDGDQPVAWNPSWWD